MINKSFNSKLSKFCLGEALTDETRMRTTENTDTDSLDILSF